MPDADVYAPIDPAIYRIYHDNILARPENVITIDAPRLEEMVDRILKQRLEMLIDDPIEFLKKFELYKPLLKI